MREFLDLKLKNINWLEIQEYYDSGKFWKDIIKEFKITNYLVNHAVKNNLLKLRSRSESTKLERKLNYRTTSDETKKKISETRIKYLKENPDKVPYLLNHSRNESYPEKYFNELFNKENIPVIKKYRIGLYELDFCIPEKRIDIEIDGNQHYLDQRIVKSDIRRNKYLENLGWDIIRINWSQYQKLNNNEKSEYIENIKLYLDNLISIKPIINTSKIKYHKKGTCLNCKKCCTTVSKSCEYCYRLNRRKVIDRPPHEILLIEIKENGYSATGRKYNVSDNTIRKWIRNYEKNSLILV